MNNEMTLSAQLAALARDPDDIDRLFGSSIEALNVEPDNPYHLFYLALSFARGSKHGVALAFYKAAHRMVPNETSIMSNIGTTLSHMGRYDEAREWFERVHRTQPDALSYANLASSYIETGDYKRGYEYATKAVSMADNPEFRATRGFAHLFLGRWDAGFEDYSAAVGGRFRKHVNYGGTDVHTMDKAQLKHGATWIMNGEQGIGDEIMYLGLLDEFRDKYKPERVIIDTDKRLARLFGRSVPWADVHGTRHVPVMDKQWLYDVDAAGTIYQMPIGELCRLVEKRAKASERGAYLKVDADMAAMYDGLMARHDGRNTTRIGLTWTGGSTNTNRERRSLGTAGLRALVKALERKYPSASFYSLQYAPEAPNDIEAAGVNVKHFNFATGLGASYDHTAAFISNLDLVVGSDTAAHHAAPAIGVDTHTLVNDRTTWIQAQRLPGGASPWYAHATLYHQNKDESWEQTIARVFAGSDPL